MCRNILIFLLIFTINCATYWGNRKRDLKDIITLGAEKKEYGAGARFGPLALGLFFQGEKDKLSNKIKGDGFGLRGGSFGKYHTEQLVFGFMGGEKFYSKIQNKRNELKKNEFNYFNFFNQKLKKRKEKKKNKYIKEVYKKIAKEQNRPEILDFIPKEEQKKYSISYFFQIEAFFGFFYGLRIGFNILEFVDFIVGFTSVDISRDDIKIKE